MNEVLEKSPLDEYLAGAKGIAWDNCHKIYILLDDEQMELMEEYGYDPLISSEEMTPSEMAVKVEEWYEDSCGLRFIQAVNGEGFHTVVSQFSDPFEDEDEEA